MDLNDLYRAGYKAGSDIADAVNDAVDNNDFSGLTSSIRKTVRDVSDSVSQDVHSSSYWYSSGTGRQDNNGSRRNRSGTRYSQSSAGAQHGDAGSDTRYSQSSAGTQHGDAGSDTRYSQSGPDSEYDRRTYRYQYRNYQETYNGSGGRGNNFSGSKTANNRSRSVFYSSQPTPFLQKRPSHQSGLLKIIFGIFGAICGALVVFNNGLALLFGGLAAGALSGFLAGAVITAAAVYAIISGSRERDLVTRYYEYGEALGNAEYIEIKKLARRTHHTADEVLKDLKKLMARGLLPEARLDEQETTLMLSEEVYEQYEAIKRRMEQQDEQREQAQQAEKAQEKDAELPEDARQIISEGSLYIQTIRRFNDEIPGQEMSDKLDRLESTMNRILEQVRRQPGSAADLRRLMNYYLPTTVKLLDAYVQLDRQDTDAENIVSTRKEIEDALDMINDAFENLLNSLFQDMAWDISSDISVMKTMFAQDGLTSREMHAGSGNTDSSVSGNTFDVSGGSGDNDSSVNSNADSVSGGNGNYNSYAGSGGSDNNNS